jgi:hypothetical protein
MTEDVEICSLAVSICREKENQILALDKKRKGHLIFLPIMILLSSVFAAPFVDLELSQKLGEPLPLWMAYVATCIFCTLIFFPAFDQDYRRKAKRDFMKMMAQSLDLQYRRGGVMALGALSAHGIFPPYTSSKVEEGFKGLYKGFVIELQDFMIKTVRSAERFDFRSLIYGKTIRGVVIRIGLKKTLKNHTILIPSNMANGFLVRNLNKKFFAHEDTPFSSNQFKESYTVLSTDPSEAHYILDPAVIERVMALKEMMRAQWLEISFRDRELIIYAQYTHNFFEIGSLLSPVNVLTIERALREMNAIKGIVDTLELTPYAGLGAEVNKRPLQQKNSWPE